jgi:hypothetical protein
VTFILLQRIAETEAKRATVDARLQDLRHQIEATERAIDEERRRNEVNVVCISRAVLRS